MTKQEQTWEYPCHFLFNQQLIINFTLTDHWKESHPEISKELICKLFLKLTEEGKVEPTKYKDKRKVYLFSDLKMALLITYGLEIVIRLINPNSSYGKPDDYCSLSSLCLKFLVNNLFRLSLLLN